MEERETGAAQGVGGILGGRPIRVKEEMKPGERAHAGRPDGDLEERRIAAEIPQRFSDRRVAGCEILPHALDRPVDRGLQEEEQPERGHRRFIP